MAGMSDYAEQLKNFNFSDLDWERIGVWPLPARIFVCFLACAVIVAGAYFLVVKDKNMQLAGAQRKEVDLKATFEKKAYEAANLEKYRQQMAEMEESFEALKKQLPKDTEVPGLLEDIDEKGIDSRLAIESITLKPEIASEFYVELPIEIKVAGGYHEFGAFVSGVAGMPRIVTLHDFDIKRDEKAGNLQMTIQAKTYRYKEQE
ncbi:MAG: type 4a pilus biogenesis protein PilO [Cellvibrionaceae bacterium]|nr:type 4a pilus biogenesis protein PilO [Cellvibrionaceae bacterium]